MATAPAVRPPVLGLIGAWMPLLLTVGQALAWHALLGTWPAALAATLAGLLLALPLLARVVLLTGGRPGGEGPLFGAVGRRWYLLQLLQVPFLRLPWIEDLLRLVPGLYQAWLCLWGGRVSLLSVWGPGVMVSDRWALEVGPGAIIGAGAIISGHLITADGAGGHRLLVAPVRIGAGAVVGGRAGLAPGSLVAAGESFPALLPLPPFTTWRDGRRWKSGAAATAQQPAGHQADGQGDRGGDP